MRVLCTTICATLLTCSSAAVASADEGISLSLLKLEAAARCRSQAATKGTATVGECYCPIMGYCDCCCDRGFPCKCGITCTCSKPRPVASWKTKVVVMCPPDAVVTIDGAPTTQRG